MLEITHITLEVSDSISHSFTKLKLYIPTVHFYVFVWSCVINVTELGHIWSQILTLAPLLTIQTHPYFLLLWDLSQTEKVVAEILIIFFFFSFFLLNEDYSKSSFFPFYFSNGSNF